MDTTSSAVDEEPEKEVGRLTSLCAVEHTGNNGLTEICAVEETCESRSAWTQELQRPFGQEISAKTIPRRRRKQARKTRLRARTAIILSTKGNDSSASKWMRA